MAATSSTLSTSPSFPMMKLETSMIRKHIVGFLDMHHMAKLSQASKGMKTQLACKVIIIGAGMAGCSAAISCAQEKLDPTLIFDDQRDAQMPLIKSVTNYPGQKEGVSGLALGSDLIHQVKKSKVHIIQGKVMGIVLSKPFGILLNENRLMFAQAIIIATGTIAKPLGLPEESRLRGKGLFPSAIRDGGRCKGQSVIVVGGGNSALGEAEELAKTSHKVTIVYETILYASLAIIDKVKKMANVEIREEMQILAIHGKEQFEGVTLKNKSGAISYCEASGLFVSNGRVPNTSAFIGKVPMREDGSIVVKDQTATEIPGIFAAGDVIYFPKYCRLPMAAGSGTTAGLQASEFLKSVK